MVGSAVPGSHASLRPGHDWAAASSRVLRDQDREGRAGASDIDLLAGIVRMQALLATRTATDVGFGASARNLT
jgi:hypothetical protein